MNQKYKLATLVIDMQPGFLSSYFTHKEDKKMFNSCDENDPPLALLPQRAKRMIGCQVELLKQCIFYKIPIWLVENEGEEKTIPPLWDIWNTAEYKIYVKKRKDSAFNRTSLEEELNGKGVKKIIIIGVYTSFCVFDTARDAIVKGFEVFTSPSLISDCSPVIQNKEWYTQNKSWYTQNCVWINKPERLLERVISE